MSAAVPVELVVFDPLWPAAEVTRRSSRRISLRLSSAGVPRVSAPNRVSVKVIKGFLRSKIVWLTRQRLSLQTVHAKLADANFGVIEIEHLNSEELGATSRNGRLLLSHPSHFNEWSLLFHPARPHIEKLLNTHAKVILPQLLDSASQVTNIMPKQTRIRYMRSRWGSCNQHGVVSLNSQLLRLNKPLIDYVITHELAHIKHHNHQREFWQLVEKFVPNYRSLRQQLKQVHLLD